MALLHHEGTRSTEDKPEKRTCVRKRSSLCISSCMTRMIFPIPPHPRCRSAGLSHALFCFESATGVFFTHTNVNRCADPRCPPFFSGRSVVSWKLRLADFSKGVTHKSQPALPLQTQTSHRLVRFMRRECFHTPGRVFVIFTSPSVDSTSLVLLSKICQLTCLLSARRSLSGATLMATL